MDTANCGISINGILLITNKGMYYWDTQKYGWTNSFPGGSDRKEPACNAGDLGLIPGSGGSLGERNSYPLSLENPIEEPGGLQSMGWQRVRHEERLTLSLQVYSQLFFKLKFFYWSMYLIYNAVSSLGLSSEHVCRHRETALWNLFLWGH